MNVSVARAPLLLWAACPGGSGGQGQSPWREPSFSRFSQLGGWALPPRYLPSLQAWRLQGWTEAPGVPSYLIPTLSPL